MTTPDTTTPILKAKTNFQYSTARFVARHAVASENKTNARANAMFQGDFKQQIVNRILIAIRTDGKKLTRNGIVELVKKYQNRDMVGKFRIDDFERQADKDDLIFFDSDGICQISSSLNELIEEFYRYYSYAESVKQLQLRVQHIASTIHANVAFGNKFAERERQMHIAMYKGEWIKMSDYEDVVMEFERDVELGVYVQAPHNPGFYQFSAKAVDVLTAFDPNKA